MGSPILNRNKRRKHFVVFTLMLRRRSQITALHKMSHPLLQCEHKHRLTDREEQHPRVNLADMTGCCSQTTKLAKHSLRTSQNASWGTNIIFRLDSLKAFVNVFCEYSQMSLAVVLEQIEINVV